MEVQQQPWEKENASWLPVMENFFMHHFFPFLISYSEREDFRDFYSCRMVNRWFKHQLKLPCVQLAPSRLRNIQRAQAIAPLVEKLICRNFSDAANISRLLESPYCGTTSLRTIQFKSSPNMKPAAWSLFFNNLHRFQSLKTLDLSEISEDLPSSVLEALGQSARWNSSLTDLRFPQAVYEGNAVNCMRNFLVTCTSLSHLQLIIRGDSSVCTSVGHLSGLESLVLRFVDHFGSNYLVNHSDVAALLRGTRKLKKLDLQHWSPWKAPQMAPVFPAIGNHESLTDLCIARFPQDTSSEAFFSMIANHKSITSLRLPLLSLDERGFAALGEAIITNKMIRYLSLNDCNFPSESSAITLANALAANSTIKHLEMRKAAMRPHPMDPVLNMIRTHSSITRLDLTGSFLGYTSICALGAALETNNLLEFLACHPWTQTNEPLFVGLSKNKTLRALIITANEIGTPDGIAFAEALSQNTSLLRLELNVGCITTEAHRALMDGLKRNTTLDVLVVRNRSRAEPIPTEGVRATVCWNDNSS